MDEACFSCRNNAEHLISSFESTFLISAHLEAESLLSVSSKSLILRTHQPNSFLSNKWILIQTGTILIPFFINAMYTEQLFCAPSGV